METPPPAKVLPRGLSVAFMNWLKRLLGFDKVTVTSEPRPSAPQVPASSPALPPGDAKPDFPFPLVGVPGAQAEREWRRLQKEWRNEGASAVLIGDADDVAQMAEAMKFNEQAPESTLQRAATMQAADYFAERHRNIAGDEGLAEMGEWPGTVVGPDLSAHCDVLSRQPKPQVFLARIPTAHAWEIPAYLKFGGWNDCPAPEEQVCVMQYWAKEYDVEIYAIAGDVVECTVGRPPASRGAAVALAEQQFLYCTDIVHQGTQTLSALAASLQDNAVWFFWWD